MSIFLLLIICLFSSCGTESQKKNEEQEGDKENISKQSKRTRSMKKKSALKINSIEPDVGIIGNHMDLKIEGHDFNSNTRIFLYQTEQHVIGSFNTENWANGITVIEDIAYLSTNSGFHIIDVHDPTNPEIIGSAKCRANDAVIVNDIAYITTDEGLNIIDVSNPSELTIVGFVNTPDEANDVFVVDNIAYVVDDTGLHLVNASNLSKPEIISSVNTPDDAEGVIVINDIAYVGDHDGLRVIDVRNTLTPKIINTIETPGYAYSVLIIDNFAYISANYDGLLVVNVSNPFQNQPVITCSVDTPDYARNLEIVDKIAYVADDDSGLQIINIKNPNNPKIIFSIDITGDVRDVAVYKNIAYLAGCDGLSIISIPTEITDVQVNSEADISISFTSPNSPGHYSLKIINDNESYEITDAVAFIDSLQNVNVSPTSYNFNSVTVGDLISKSFTITNFTPSEMMISSANISGIDQSEFSIQKNSCDNVPIKPSESCSLEISFSPKSTGAKSAILFVQPKGEDITPLYSSLSGYGYAPLKPKAISFYPSMYNFGNIDLNKTSLPKTFSISNTSQSEIKIDSLSISGSDYSEFTILNDHCSGNTLHISGECSVQVVFLPKSNENKCASLSVSLKNDASEAFELPMFGSCCCETELKFFSIEPNIGLMGSNMEVTIRGENFTEDTKVFMYCRKKFVKPFLDNRSFGSGGIVVQDDIAYVAGYKLYIFNVSDPFHAYFFRSIETGLPYDVEVVNNTAFVSYNNGISIIDVNNQYHPKILSSIFTPDAQKIRVIDGMAYLADYDYGLQIIDVSRPELPEIINPIDNSLNAIDIEMLDGIAYVLEKSSLHLIDVTNPYLPNKISSSHIPGSAECLTVVDSIAYVANKSKVLLISVINPSQPELINSINIPGVDVKVLGNIAYIANKDGLYVIDVSNPFQPNIITTIDIPDPVEITIANDIVYSVYSDGLAIASLPIEIKNISVNSDKKISFKVPSTCKSGDYSFIVYNETDVKTKIDALSFVETMPDLHVNPKYHNYKVIQLGEISTPQIYTITNYSNSLLFIESISITGKDSSNFLFQKNTCLNDYYLEPSQKCNVEIIFASNKIGINNSILSIKTNSDDSVYESRLSGFGYKNLFQNKLSSSLSGYDYGVIDVNSSSLAKTFTIYNKSLMSIELEPLSITGTNQTDYELINDQCSGIFLSSSEACNLQVVFTPKSCGSKNAMLFISSKNDRFSQLELSLFGSGKTDSELKVLSVEPNIGIVNNNMDATINGEGFTEDSNVYICMNESYVMDSVNAKSVVVNNEIAYVAAGWGGLKIIDMSNPFQPKIKSTLDLAGYIKGVLISDNILYALNDVELYIIDINNPNNPEIIDSLNAPAKHTGIYVADGIAFLGYNNSLEIKDITNSLKVQHIASVDLTSAPNDIMVVDGIAYLAKDDSLQLINVNNPYLPQIISSLSVNSESVFVDYDIAYVAAGSDGLQVIDVKNPFQPKIIGAVDTPGYAEHVIILDKIAYIADSRYGMHIIDVNNPFHPDIMFSIDTTGEVENIMIVNDIAYMADFRDGLKIVSLPLCIKSEYVNSENNISINYTAPEKPGSYSLKVFNGKESHELVNAISFIPEINMNPIQYNFNSIQTGNISSTKSFTITNNSNSDIGIESVSLTGTNHTEFIIQENSCHETIIKPSEKCFINVSFSPSSLGYKTAKLSFITTDQFYNSNEIFSSLSGYVQNVPSKLPEITVSPSGHDFGIIDIGKSSPIETFTISNSSQTDLELGQIIIAGDYSEFTIINDHCSEIVLTASDECNLQVSFSPESVGIKKSTLLISIFNSNSPIFELQLFATGNDNVGLQLHSILVDITGREGNLHGNGFSEDTGVFIANRQKFYTPVPIYIYWINSIKILNNIIYLIGYQEIYPIKMSMPFLFDDSFYYHYFDFDQILKIDEHFFYLLDEDKLKILENINNTKNTSYDEVIYSIDLPESDSNVITDNDNAYVTSENNLLMIDPFKAKLIGKINISGRVLDIDNDIAYLSHTENELSLVDLSDPFDPTVLSTLNISETINAITIQDDIAFVTCQNSLYLITIKNPYQPEIMGSIAISGNWIKIFDNTIYLTNQNILYMIDVRNPYNPTLITTIENIPFSNDIIRIDNILYMVYPEKDGLSFIALPTQLESVHVNNHENLSFIIPESFSSGEYDLFVYNGREKKELNNQIYILDSQQSILISPDSHDFDTIKTNTSGFSQCFTITALTDVSINQALIKGSNNTDFKIIKDSCTEAALSQAENCTIHVSFSPESFGRKNAYLKIQLNDSIFDTGASLTGWGYNDVLPGLYVSPQSHVFQSGIQSSQVFTIHNFNDEKITIDNLFISENEQSNFSIIENNCTNYPLSPFETCTISVSFTPDSNEEKSATLNIHTDKEFDSLIKVHLTESKQNNFQFRFKQMWPCLKQPWYFKGLTGITVDNKGFVFVTDSENNSIRKLTSEGHIIGTFDYNAGSNGLLHDIDVDNHGFVYVLDKENGTILKFSENGQLNQIWESQDSEEGLFNDANGIAIDFEGIIYVADTGNNLIRRMNLKGQFLTSIEKNGELSIPSDVAVDSYGFLYVADKGNNRIKKFTSEGVLTKEWYIKQPERLAASNGNFLYCYQNKKISKWTFDGEFVRDIYNNETNLSDAHGLAVDSHGIVYFTEKNSIEKFSGNGLHIERLSSFENSEGMFNYPSDLTIDTDDTIYILDNNNHRIQKLTNDETFLSIDLSKSDQQLNPKSITIDSYGHIVLLNENQIVNLTADGSIFSKWELPFDLSNGCIAIDQNNFLYIVDTSTNIIHKFTSDGQLLSSWTAIDLKSPHIIAVDQKGFVYIADATYIHKFTTDGYFVNKWETDNISAMSIDKAGFIYAADGNNNNIKLFSSDGTLKTTFGTLGTGPGQFDSPAGLCIRSNGTVYISDQNNHRIQAFDKDKRKTNSKAIIVAGGGAYIGNNLWDSTKMCANFAYRTLTYQGFTKESIYYLNLETTLDLDGNGLGDDVDADVSVVNLEKAFQWAYDADTLIVYLVDHGDDRTLRMRSDEILDAEKLNEFLYFFNGTLIFIYDACKSGSFVETLENYDKKQIIITSSLPNQSAHFISKGAISFSYFFWTHIFNGLNVQLAFELTEQAMKDYQTAKIEDNQHLASKTIIGNATQIYGDAPVIETVTTEQFITDTSSALITAYTVTDNGNINRVWALIWPPDYSPKTTLNPAKEFPSIDLFKSDKFKQNQYEGIYKNFYTKGTYQIVVYAIDNQGNTSIPKLTQFIVDNPLRRRAIIISGDAKKDAIKNSANFAYAALKNQFYSDEDIYYMSSSAFENVDCSVSLEHLEEQIKLWSENTKDLIIYMVGDGNSNSFTMNKESLNFVLLRQWLDSFQEKVSGNVITIYDAPNSGASIPLLGKDSQKRIIITGSSADQPAHFSSKGVISFSGFFWRSIYNGGNINTSFNNAKDAIENSFPNQLPQIDDSGNGISNERWIDGREIANTTYIGYGIMLAGDDPFIASVSPEQHLNGGPAAYIWAEKITTTNKVEKVWAIISPPDTSTYSSDMIISLPELELFYNPESNRYEGIYDNFSQKGKYQITIVAQDKKGNISFPVNTSVSQNISSETPVNNMYPQDYYEDDDTFFKARLLDKSQRHNFHDAGDTDWIMFYAVNSLNYTITAKNLEINCDVTFEIFDMALKPLIHNSVNNGKAGENEILNWKCTKDDLLYVKIAHYDIQTYGANTGYELNIENSQTSDMYENDNDMHQAKVIIINDDFQQHNFHSNEDEDWVKFYGINGISYEIETNNLSDGCEYSLELYNTDIYLDVYTNANLYKTFHCERNDVYFIKFYASPFCNLCKGSIYQIKVYYTTAPNLPVDIYGSIRDACNFNGIIDANIITCEKSTITFPNGYFQIRNHETYSIPNLCSMSVKADDYVDYVDNLEILQDTNYDVLLMRGDYNKDNDIDLADIIFAMKTISDNSTNTNDIELKDVLQILQIISGTLVPHD